MSELIRKAVELADGGRAKLTNLEKTRLELRLAALEDDWHRMRDIEQQWRDLSRYTSRIAVALLFIMAVTSVAL